jgi:hypothetical protein
MSSDWKESGIKKRDFQHSKSDPEIAKPRGKKKSNKPYMLVIKNFGWFKESKKDFVFGRYATLKSAKEALKQKSVDGSFWGKYEMEIQEKSEFK